MTNAAVAATSAAVGLVVFRATQPNVAPASRPKPALPSFRAILTTGYGLDGKAQEILDLGMRGFLQKPFTVTALAEKVSQVLAGSTSL